MGEKGGDKIDAKIVKKSQDTLGKIVKKPPLTEKLLNKPPFRFLHDVISSVVKSTGFMKGLFTEAEGNSENVKDRESKIAFLQKVIDMVSLVLGKTISVKPAKIVAGQEAERTNELLQGLADAINKKVNNDEYVQRVLKGGDAKPPSGGSAKKESRDSDRRKKDKEDEKKPRDDRKDREKSRDREKDRSKDREKSRDKDKPRDKDRDKSRDRRDKDRDRSKDKDDGGHRDRRKRREEEKTDGGKGASEPEAQEAAKGNTMNMQKEEDARQGEREKSSRHRSREGPVGEDDLPPQVAAARKMQRPSSARPAPPRIKKDGQDEPVSLGNSNVPNLIVDKDDSDEDEDIFAKEEEEPEQVMTSAPKQDLDDEGDHGGLVKKILETKKELEGGSQQPGKKTQIERAHVNDATRRKEREMVQKEIDKLRTSIQTLTRSVNPLGKILDFLQEDLDSMQKELVRWQDENKRNAVALQREQSITDSSIEPLRAQLVEMDSAVTDQLDLIAAVKHNTLKNDDKIEKMLSTVTKS